MKRPRFPRTLLVSFAAFALMLVAARTAYVASMVEKIQDVRGVWGGFNQVIEVEERPGLIELEVTGQAHRRFEGRMIVDEDMPEPYLVRGTVAANDAVHARGDGETNSIIVHFRLADFGGGAAILEGGSKAVGNPDLRLADILLRDFGPHPEKPTPNFTGHFEGEIVSEVDGTTQRLSMESRRRQSPTGFAGRLQLSGLEERGLSPSDWTATVDGDGNLVLVGMASGLTVKMLGRFFNPQPDPPGRIEGVYQILSVGDPNQSFDDLGTFVARQVLVNPVPEVPEDDEIPVPR